MAPLKTLFLNPPSFENFDGGASSRWPATREIESYWYPVWLAYPAGMLEGSRLLDAPPHHVRAAGVSERTNVPGPLPGISDSLCPWKRESNRGPERAGGERVALAESGAIGNSPMGGLTIER